MKSLPTQNWHFSYYSTGLYMLIISCSMSVLPMNLLALWGQAIFPSCLQCLGDCNNVINIDWMREWMNEWMKFLLYNKLVKKMTMRQVNYLGSNARRHKWRLEGSGIGILNPCVVQGSVYKLILNKKCLNNSDF